MAIEVTVCQLRARDIWESCWTIPKLWSIINLCDNGRWEVPNREKLYPESSASQPECWFWGWANNQRLYKGSVDVAQTDIDKQRIKNKQMRDHWYWRIRIIGRRIEYGCKNFPNGYSTLFVSDLQQLWEHWWKSSRKLKFSNQFSRATSYKLKSIWLTITHQLLSFLYVAH
jgi:hypothetical protein